jgi:Domain of unknown function (DUF4129)
MTRGGKLAVTGIALAALLAVVAIASRAHQPGGGNGAAPSHPPILLAEYAASLMAVLMPIGAVLVIWAWSLRRREALLRGGTTWRQFLAVLVIAAAFLPFAFFSRSHLHFLHGGAQKQPPAGATSGKPLKKHGKGSNTSATKPFHFQLLPTLIVLSILLGLGGVAAWTVMQRRLAGDEWDREAQLKAALDAVLADTLDDLRAERDPRKAVIRTYARMEQTFAAYGVPREESETPLEYVERVLARLSVSSFAINRITQLFARAKFSSHEIDAGMKDDAIDALVGLRAELETKPAAA